MSDNKKYYYMRLKENFFDSDQIVLLESMPDGVLYSNILLKMYLKSLKNNGLLMINDLIPYNAQMIATITRQPIGVVEKALGIFQALNLIDVLESGAIYMSDIELFIGQSSTEAERKKLRRHQVLQLPKIEEKTEERTNVGQMSTIDRYRDRDIDIDKNILSSILDYLNEKAGTKYRASSKNTQKHIHARLSEGYTLEDFKKVIDNKVADWGNNEKMAMYLRPDTLFGTKFESYLNQKPVENKKPSIEINSKQREGMVDVVDWGM